MRGRAIPASRSVFSGPFPGRQIVGVAVTGSTDGTLAASIPKVIPLGATRRRRLTERERHREEGQRLRLVRPRAGAALVVLRREAAGQRAEDEAGGREAQHSPAHGALTTMTPVIWSPCTAQLYR